MKKFTTKLFILIMALMPIINVMAQTSNEKNTKETVPLKPLFEMFTSSTCPPCAYANPFFDEMMDANPGTHSVIKYQMDWPGVGDPYYTAECGVRGSYYAVASVPDLYVNAQDESPSGVSQEIYDGYQTWTTSMEIEVLIAEIDLDNVISIEANLNALDNYEAGLTAHVVVVEKLTVENVGSNGETEFHNVMMKMFPDAGGTTLPALSDGSTETLIFTFDMDDTFMETANDLRVIIFVQDDSDQSVIQSEQVEVAHSLEDYTITFNMLDFNSDPVEGATLIMDGYGSAVSNAAGQIIYTGVLPGNYSYSAVASGLIPTDGDIEVVDADLTVEVQFGDPGYYYYEDFTDEIPANYTVHSTGTDFLYWYDGVIHIFRQSGSLDPLMLVTEAIDITPGEKIWFDIGMDSGFPMELVFGTVTDPDDPETFIEIETIVPTVEWETHEYLLEDILPGQVDVYFAWKHNTTAMTFCSLDNVKINYKEVADTYLAYFSVYDGAEPLEGAEITINGETETTDDNGSALFVDLADGLYNYTITALGYIEYDDQFEVAGADANVEVNLLIDGISETGNSLPQIHPNPSSDYINISMNENILSIDVYNISGKHIENYQLGSQEFQMDVTKFEKGIYLLKVNTHKTIFTQKIIVE